jgi:protocatechuate 3,4-dioxygenase beta subunit
LRATAAIGSAFTGRFAFRTIVAGPYPGRTRHYHVKIQAPGQSPVLTTQFISRRSGETAATACFAAS